MIVPACRLYYVRFLRFYNLLWFVRFIAFTFCIGFMILWMRNIGVSEKTRSDSEEIQDQILDLRKLPRMLENEVAQYLGKVSDHGIHKSNVVIVFATKRSGSSLLGQFFNQNRNCFYLFEPLFPYTRYCEVLQYDRVKLLQQFSSCNFSQLSSEYARAFHTTKHTDENSKCLKHNLCFSQQNVNILYRYAAACKTKHISFQNLARFVPESTCGYPLDLNILSTLCSSADLVAYKIIRICNMGGLDELVRKRNVTLIYLVRDPRAIISSRLQLDNDEMTNNTLEFGVSKVCSEIRRNLKYSFIMGKETGFVRMRYEDIVTKPLANAYKIYRLIDRELPTSVKLWIRNSFLNQERKERASDDPYSTVKFVLQSLTSWRHKLSIQQTMMIQNHCYDVMKILGYKLVNSIEEQKNWNQTLWQ